MTKTFTAAEGLIVVIALSASFLILVPSRTSAVATNASLGGGNALERATGQSQGLSNASSSSNILAHLTFASTRGGRPAEVPPASSGGANNGDENAGTGSENNSGQGNGGASSGNGGNGGSGGIGGLVRAGSVVSNATAVNMINANIVRIRSR